MKQHQELWPGFFWLSFWCGFVPGAVVAIVLWVFFPELAMIIAAGRS